MDMARVETKSETKPEGKSDTEHGVYFSDVYEKLAATFDGTFKDVRGGIELEYITGEQAVSRLNEVLGVAGWSFRILEHGYNQEADEIWVLAELTANFGGASVVRQQFGSQKVKRSRTTDSPLDIGFDLKGATTDALKKCASLIGVGLYLSRKETPAEREASAASNGSNGRSSNGATANETYTCEQCDEELKEVRFRDGTTWTPSLLASYGRRKHGKVLCMQHYRDANEARKKAETQAPSMEEVPF
jgi:hypothetical protein